jgi:hypothetical protein
VATRGQFHDELMRLFQHAVNNGLENIEVSAGELHRSVGGYPGPDHRMPVCCSVMRSEFSADCDLVLESPPKGDGASLTIRYNLPRKVEFNNRHLEGDRVAAKGSETAEQANQSPYEAVIRQMMTREDELTNQRMLWMAAFNGLLFAALGFAWDKPAARFLSLVFCALGLSTSALSGFGLFLSSSAQRRLLLFWHKKRPKDYDGPGVVGAEPLDSERLYSMYGPPWIWLTLIFSVGWFLIWRFVFKYVR